MNSRILIVSDDEVRIKRNGYKERDALDWRCTFHADHDGLVAYYEGGGERWDAEGLSALRDCINCLEATGSFAALADTSPIPFSGKQMRTTSGDEIVIIGADSKYEDNSRWYATYTDREGKQYDSTVHRSQLKSFIDPTPPAPKYRAMTPVEAAAHLGRLTNGGRNQKPWTVGAIGNGGVKIEENGLCVNFESFAKEWTWADDNSPCGTLQP